MKLAKNVTIDRKSGVVTIDGEELGFYLADEQFDISADTVSVVRLPILAESVTVLPIGD